MTSMPLRADYDNSESFLSAFSDWQSSVRLVGDKLQKMYDGTPAQGAKPESYVTARSVWMKSPLKCLPVAIDALAGALVHDDLSLVTLWHGEEEDQWGCIAYCEAA